MGDPKEQCVRSGSRIFVERGNFRGNGAARWGECVIDRAKTAEAI